MTKNLFILSIVALVIASVGFASSPKQVVTISGNTVGGTLTLTGCGFRTGYDDFIYLYKAGDTTELVGYATHTDSNGCFTTPGLYVFTEPGSYEVYVYQIKGSTGPGSYNLNHPAADVDFDVT